MSVKQVLRLTERQIRKVSKSIDKKEELDTEDLNAFTKLLNCYSRLLEQSGQSLANISGGDDLSTVGPSGYPRGFMRSGYKN